MFKAPIEAHTNVQIEVIARYSHKFNRVSYGDQLKSLTEDFDNGMITKENLFNTLESMGNGCYSHYLYVHNGIMPGFQ